MKKHTLLLSFLVCTSMAFAQVGINTTTPNATLEVVGKGATTTIPDGIIAPRISKQQLAAKTAGTYGSLQTAAVVFVNDITTPTGTIPSLAQVAEVTALGYYYFNGTIWKAIGGAPATVDTSIYLNDGTLAGNRTVTQGASTLAFTASALNAFSVDGTTLSVDAANHRVGVGTAAPQRPLDVNANTGPVRFENLATLPVNTASSGLVIDTNGDIYKNNSVSVEGQILRVGINSATYNITAGSESSLRFNSEDSATEMGNAPNTAPNYINTLVGAVITDGVSVAAGTGTVARTTDQITLPVGVYKVQVRLVGSFNGFAGTSTTLFLKTIVNNNEYSLVNYSNPTTSPSVFYYDDYINITGSPQTLDFSISPSGNTFTTTASNSVGGGNSFRSLILIQRLR